MKLLVYLTGICRKGRSPPGLSVSFPPFRAWPGTFYTRVERKSRCRWPDMADLAMASCPGMCRMRTDKTKRDGHEGFLYKEHTGRPRPALGATEQPVWLGP